jgi:hypothetical protein
LLLLLLLVPLLLLLPLVLLECLELLEICFGSDCAVADAEATCPFAFKRFPLWQMTARLPFFLQFVQVSAFAGQFCMCS